ncbi:MAG TPA: methyltransferase domain-containing protein [Candidatus Limnocylindrales bacterium]|jgi:SAM-dependent methyltransferase
MSFDVAAEAYDTFMGAWSRPLSPQLADFAGIRAGDRVIDVGCGPGALTAELVARVGAEAVAAVDPSESFVGAARKRHPGVDVRQAPAESLPHPDDTFDAALAQLVVHFMKDPGQGLREMSRVTRRGGVVAACVWDHAGGQGPLGTFWDAAHALDPSVEDESRLAGAREGHLVELLGAAGLRDVAGTVLTTERAYDSFEDWWEPYLRAVGPAGAYVASLEPERQAALRDRCRSMLPGGSFVLTARAWAARGLV